MLLFFALLAHMWLSDLKPNLNIVGIFKFHLITCLYRIVTWPWMPWKVPWREHRWPSNSSCEFIHWEPPQRFYCRADGKDEQQNLVWAAKQTRDPVSLILKLLVTQCVLLMHLFFFFLAPSGWNWSSGSEKHIRLWRHEMRRWIWQRKLTKKLNKLILNSSNVSIEDGRKTHYVLLRSSHPGRKSHMAHFDMSPKRGNELPGDEVLSFSFLIWIINIHSQAKIIFPHIRKWKTCTNI